MSYARYAAMEAMIRTKEVPPQYQETVTVPTAMILPAEPVVYTPKPPPPPPPLTQPQIAEQSPTQPVFWSGNVDGQKYLHTPQEAAIDYTAARKYAESIGLPADTPAEHLMPSRAIPVVLPDREGAVWGPLYEPTYLETDPDAPTEIIVTDITTGELLPITTKKYVEGKTKYVTKVAEGLAAEGREVYLSGERLGIEKYYVPLAIAVVIAFIVVGVALAR